MIELQQSWPMQDEILPIVIFGSGSIVNDAHLPAYKNSGFEIRGIYDPDLSKAEGLAAKYNINTFGTVQESIDQKDAIFDLATPPAAPPEILKLLPYHSGVLIQKPIGSNLINATEILSICRERSLKAAVNFQLRFSPIMLALYNAIDKGMLGKLVDFDLWLALDTP